MPARSTTRTRWRPTARGIALALLGAALLAGSALTGLEPARTLGIALLLIALLGALLSLLLGVGLRAEVQASARTVTVGESVTLTARLADAALAARLPLGRVHWQLQPPAVLIRRRGTRHLGAATLRAQDVLGIARLTRTQAPAAIVTGVPALEEVPGSLIHALVRDTGGRSGSGTATSRSREIGPIPRAYAPGDDVRRIHWRASARGFGLMTRDEEPIAQRAALLILDTRAPAAPPADETAQAARTAEEDRAVQTAASLVAALQDHGFAPQLLDAAGTPIAPAGDSLELLLLRLADLPFDAPADADPDRLPAHRGAPARLIIRPGQDLLAVLGAEPAAAPARHRSGGER